MNKTLASKMNLTPPLKSHRRKFVGFFYTRKVRGVFLFILLFSFITLAFADLPTQGKASYYTVQSCLNEGNSGICANNKPLDDTALTCALPSHYYIGKKFKVTNVSNGKSVICLVTDFGPNDKLFYEKNIIVDLSQKAFSQIASLDKGIIDVRIKEMK